MLMAESITLEKADRPSGDMLGELFKEGAMDPSHLPMHPCPPGKKDDTMRTDLMDFQVRASLDISCPASLPPLTLFLQLQKQGLAWMINMEHPQLPKTIDDPPTQLWVMRKDTEVSSSPRRA
jgi:SWI/SNF-related matrix-associated actin-dependent regulator of chromatin subfamily A3